MGTRTAHNLQVSVMPNRRLRWIGLPALALLAALVVPANALASTADHSKFKELQGPFGSGPEVTKACLACHTEAARQIHKTKHWTGNSSTPSRSRCWARSTW